MRGGIQRTKPPQFDQGGWATLREGSNEMAWSINHKPQSMRLLSAWNVRLS